jgi:hypothetical protein
MGKLPGAARASLHPVPNPEVEDNRIAIRGADLAWLGLGWLATPSLYDSFICDSLPVNPGAIQSCAPRPPARSIFIFRGEPQAPGNLFGKPLVFRHGVP